MQELSVKYIEEEDFYILVRCIKTLLFSIDIPYKFRHIKSPSIDTSNGVQNKIEKIIFTFTTKKEANIYYYVFNQVIKQDNYTVFPVLTYYGTVIWCVQQRFLFFKWWKKETFKDPKAALNHIKYIYSKSK